MSGDSTSSALQSAPIVIAFAGGSSPSSGAATASICTSSSCRVMPGLSAGDVRELELADLELVAVLEPVGLDAMAVDVGAVERAEVVEVVVAAAAHEQGVVARDGDVVEEDVGVRAPADRHAVGVQREALADAAAAGADDERGALVGDDVADVDRHELAGLVDAVRGGGGLARRRLLARRAQVGAAARAVVRALGVDEAALRAVERHPEFRYSVSCVSPAARPARMSVSLWTSSPVMTSSPPSCFLRSRLTSSARRMSILPWRMRRL